MKTKIGILVLMLFAGFASTKAQQRVYTTTRATSFDISDNLDLDAVSSIFAESKNLEDFEYRLNDPENRISNLDLNEDGYVDYLRVLETTSNDNSLVVIQAVLDKDVYQDVATIEIERRPNGNHRIQVVGDAYIYGANYIIEPVFVRPPLIFSFFWGPRYVVWNSPYYWGYYPRWYSYWRPYPAFKYHRYVRTHIDRHITFNRIPDRHFHVSGDSYNHLRRNDYANRYPERAFENRNRDVRNRGELINHRNNNYRNNSANDGRRPNSQVRPDRRPNAGQDVKIRPNSGTRDREKNMKQGDVPKREYSRESNRRPDQYNSGKAPKSSETYTRRSAPERRPQVKEGSYKRTETPNRVSAPTEKSAGVVKSKSAEKLKRSAESPKQNTTEKKENHNRRR